MKICILASLEESASKPLEEMKELTLEVKIYCSTSMAIL